MSETRDPDHSNAERAINYVSHLHDYYSSYHDHKEAMAYSGFALQIGAFGAALISEAWPPKWGLWSIPLSLLAITAAWLFILVFIKWQLTRRRWAALRVAGVDRVLARWIVIPPSAKDLAPCNPQSGTKRGWWVQVLDHVWPLRSAVAAVDVAETVYPSALVQEWREQATQRGTQAIFHERLVVLAGWALYLALVVRTAID